MSGGRVRVPSRTKLTGADEEGGERYMVRGAV